MYNEIEYSSELVKNSNVPMKDNGKCFNVLNEKVGKPDERLISRELLIPAPSGWNCFPKATKAKIREISESIRQYGLFHNITVWEQADGSYMILGGHTRVACFDYLAGQDNGDLNTKWSQIPALVYAKNQLTDIDAQRIIILSNTDQRELSAMTKARAYMNLLKLEKEKAFYGRYVDSMESAAALADVSRAGFYQYLCLLKLIPELQEAVDSGEMPMKVGFNISGLEEKLQRYIYDEHIFERISVQAAAEIGKCETVNELKNKLDKIENATKYYKYKVITKHQKPSDEEILPIFVKKHERNQIADLYIKAVLQSDFSAELSDKLVSIMENAKMYI